MRSWNDRRGASSPERADWRRHRTAGSPPKSSAHESRVGRSRWLWQYRRIASIGGSLIAAIVLVGVLVWWVLRPQHHTPLLVISVIEYDHQELLPPNPFADEDQQWLKKLFGPPGSDSVTHNIAAHVVASDGRIERRMLHRAVEQVISRSEFQPGGPNRDAVLCYIRTIGMVTDADGDYGGVGLVLSDTDPRQPEELYPLQALLLQLAQHKKLDKAKKIVFLDLGTMTTNLELGIVSNRVAERARLTEIVKSIRDPNLVVIVAQRGREPSQGIPRTGHTAFVTAMVAALFGDRNKSDAVELDEVVAVVEEQVKDLTRQFCPEVQHVQVIGPFANSDSTARNSLPAWKLAEYTPVPDSVLTADDTDDVLATLKHRLGQWKEVWDTYNKVRQQQPYVWAPLAWAECESRLLRLQQLALAGTGYEKALDRFGKEVQRTLSRLESSRILPRPAVSPPSKALWEKWRKQAHGSGEVSEGPFVEIELEKILKLGDRRDGPWKDEGEAILRLRTSMEQLIARPDPRAVEVLIPMLGPLDERRRELEDRLFLLQASDEENRRKWRAEVEAIRARVKKAKELIDIITEIYQELDRTCAELPRWYAWSVAEWRVTNDEAGCRAVDKVARAADEAADWLASLALYDFPNEISDDVWEDVRKEAARHQKNIEDRRNDLDRRLRVSLQESLNATNDLNKLARLEALRRLPFLEEHPKVVDGLLEIWTKPDADTSRERPQGYGGREAGEAGRVLVSDPAITQDHELRARQEAIRELWQQSEQLMELLDRSKAPVQEAWKELHARAYRFRRLCPTAWCFAHLDDQAYTPVPLFRQLATAQLLRWHRSRTLKDCYLSPVMGTDGPAPFVVSADRRWSTMLEQWVERADLDWWPSETNRWFHSEDLEKLSDERRKAQLIVGVPGGPSSQQSKAERDESTDPPTMHFDQTFQAIGLPKEGRGWTAVRYEGYELESAWKNATAVDVPRRHRLPLLPQDLAERMKRTLVLEDQGIPDGATLKVRAFFRGASANSSVTTPRTVGPLPTVVARRNLGPARVTVSTPKGNPLLIVFVLDCSGSMGNNFGLESGSRMKAATEQLRELIRVVMKRLKVSDVSAGLVLFGNQFLWDKKKKVFLHLTNHGEKPVDDPTLPYRDVSVRVKPSRDGLAQTLEILNHKGEVASRGQTPLYLAIATAIRLAERTSRLDDVRRHVIVISDGQDQKHEVGGRLVESLGYDRKLKNVLHDLRTDIHVHVIHIGDGGSPRSKFKDDIGEENLEKYFTFHKADQAAELLRLLKQSIGLHRYRVRIPTESAEDHGRWTSWKDVGESVEVDVPNRGYGISGIQTEGSHGQPVDKETFELASDQHIEFFWDGTQFRSSAEDPPSLETRIVREARRRVSVTDICWNETELAIRLTVQDMDRTNKIIPRPRGLWAEAEFIKNGRSVLPMICTADLEFVPARSLPTFVLRFQNVYPEVVGSEIKLRLWLDFSETKPAWQQDRLESRMKNVKTDTPNTRLFGDGISSVEYGELEVGEEFTYVFEQLERAGSDGRPSGLHTFLWVGWPLPKRVERRFRMDGDTQRITHRFVYSSEIPILKARAVPVARMKGSMSEVTSGPASGGRGPIILRIGDR